MKGVDRVRRKRRRRRRRRGKYEIGTDEKCLQREEGGIGSFDVATGEASTTFPSRG